VKDEIHTAGGVQNALVIAYIANVKLEFWAGVALTHVILFFLVPAEDTDLFDVCIQEALKDGVTKGAGTASYE
jgi:hypothetical protein